MQPAQKVSRKEGDDMAIYHCSIKIISRAGGRSAVASAAIVPEKSYITMKQDLHTILQEKVEYL